MVSTHSASLTNHIVLVTGAIGHLGSAISKAILEAGGTVIAASRNERALNTYRQRLLDADQKERFHVLACDITSESSIKNLISTIDSRFSRLDGVVNNAYAGKVGSLDRITAEDFHLATTYNLVAPFLLVREGQGLLENAARVGGRSASVVNISSMYGLVSPNPSMYGESGLNNPIHYGATKAGMIHMTRYLACHLASRGIRVNSITPGPFPDLTSGSLPPSILSRLVSSVPLNRVGVPSEMGGAVVFLLSAASSFVTGANLPVDGGWTAW